jgi:hypothetical protein
MAMEIVPLKKIKPYWRNARDNTQAVGPVIESIKKFGYAQPILVDKSYVIIAGHTRYAALQEMGWKEAPVIVLNLPEKKANQYRIVDNKTSEFSKWKKDELLQELRAFDNLDKDFQVFFKDDLVEMMNESTGKKSKDVSDKKMAKSKEKLDSKMVNASRVDQLEVECPFCEEQFFLNRADLLKTPEKSKS